MSLFPNCGRQTTILDGAQALAIAQPPTKNTPNGKNMSQVSKLARSTRIIGGSRFYGNNGLKIPLFDKSEKRRSARAIKTIYGKNSKAVNLQIVKTYAGQTKYDELKDSSGMVIAEWIAQAETEALPQSTRAYKKKLTSPLTEVEAEENEQNEEDVAGGLLVMYDSQLSIANSDMAIAQPSLKSNENRMQAGSPHDILINIPSPSHLIGTLIMPSPSKAPISLAAAAAAREARPNAHTSLSKPMLKRRARDEENTSNGNSNMYPTYDPPRAKKHKTSFREKTPESKSVHVGTTATQLKQASVPHHRKATKEPIRTRPHLDMKNMTRHPALDAFDLDPSSADHFMVVIDNPEEEEHIIFCATSEVTVYETHISYTRVKPQAPDTPFLKQGAHGYDWENSRWHIPEHKDATDLHTGRGHQVDPADQERMRMDPSFETDFLKKYPGLRAGAHQWPCGCHVFMDEYDSEEE